MKIKPGSTFRGLIGFHMTIGLFILICSTLLACGGGGGGGGGGGSLEYDGVTTPASLTTDNTEGLIGESLQGALTSDSMVPFAGLGGGGANGDDQPISAPIALDLQSVFANSLTQALAEGPGGGGGIATAAMQTIEMDGDCGGSASYTIDFNEGTGFFSGSFRYNAFCNGGVSLSGSAEFEGRLDGESSFDYFSFSFSSLTTTVDGLSNTVSGSLECEFSGSDFVITTDMVVQLSGGRDICWLNDYTIQVSGVQMEISGRFYHPLHGFVEFETLTPLIISEFSEYPSSGQVEFTGAEGPGGQPTKALLTAHSETTCQVTADTDGDGVTDFDTGVIFWTDL